MSTFIKFALLALSTAGLWAPPLAHAEVVSRITPMRALTEPAQPAREARDFLSQVLERDRDGYQDRDGLRMERVREPGLATRLAAFDGRDGGREFTLNFGRVTPPPAQLRGETDLFLWSLLRLVQAQKEGKHFELVDRGVEFVISNSNQPSAVPLPGALWLFVMGLLGLAGTRLTGKRDEPATAGRREPALPLGSSPMPA